MPLPLNNPLLIVEDSETAYQLLAGFSKELGFKTILYAADGKQALGVIQQQDPKNPIGLILADWNMPQMSGIDLLKAIRAQPSSKNVPFVMITADSEMDMIVQAISAGVSSYIVKPVTLENLKAKIDAVFLRKK